MQFRSSQIMFSLQTFQYHAAITLEEIHTDFLSKGNQPQSGMRRNLTTKFFGHSKQLCRQQQQQQLTYNKNLKKVLRI